jgi:hypothetical protein
MHKGGRKMAKNGIVESIMVVLMFIGMSGFDSNRIMIPSLMTGIPLMYLWMHWKA